MADKNKKSKKSDKKRNDEKNKYKIKKIIKELESIRGRHTELVSVYIPSGYNVVDVIGQLKDEQGTAANIKSKATRKNVMSALEKIIQHLRVFRKTPPNGLVVFAGNVSETEGKEDIKIWSFEPAESLKTKIYWCDQAFVLDPLREMIKDRDIYGLIVLDAREANIGLLSGKTIKPLKHLDSTVPSKTVKGGMCLNPDTLIQLHNGRIIEIGMMSEEDNPILSSDLNNYKTTFALHNDIMKRPVSGALKITTKAPAFEIIITPEHRFFIPSRNGIDIIYAGDLKEKDDILIAKKINTSSVLPRFDSRFLNHKRKNELFLYQIIGYIFGDGTKDVNRIIIYDKNENLIDKYRDIAEKLFKVNTGKRFRKRVKGGKGSFEVKIYSKKLMETINNTFVGIFEKERRIHPIIQKLPLKHLGRFISGLFDAEGYVDRSARVLGITMSTKPVIKMLQLMFLRFGIIASYREELYKGKYHKYHLIISDYESLKLFEKHIGFLSNEKMDRLKNIIKKTKKQSYANQVPVKGSFIIKLARELGMNMESFPKTQDFFYDKKRQSFKVFKREIIGNFKRRLKEINNTPQVETSETLQKGKIILDLLNKIADSDFSIAKIHKIEKIKINSVFYDISIPVTQNFLANGIVVHNSQHRYDRIREDAIHEFLTKVGDAGSEILLKHKDALKGLIIGGPGPVKDRFAKGKYLNYMLLKKLIGVKDIGYTGEVGLNELVERAEDLLKESAIAHEKEILQNFFTRLEKDGAVTYGVEEVKQALEAGSVDTLLISEDFDWVRVNFECQCGFQIKLDVPRTRLKSGPAQRCEKCKARMKPDKGEMLELTDVLIEQAEKTNAKVEMISIETREGYQFKELGGLGAILRFKLS